MFLEIWPSICEDGYDLYLLQWQSYLIAKLIYDNDFDEMKMKFLSKMYFKKCNCFCEIYIHCDQYYRANPVTYASRRSPSKLDLSSFNGWKMSSNCRILPYPFLKSGIVHAKKIIDKKLVFSRGFGDSSRCTASIFCELMHSNLKSIQFISSWMSLKINLEA